MYRRPKLHHGPGLTRSPCFYETHQLRLALAYGGWARIVFAILRINRKKHWIGVANE